MADVVNECNGDFSIVAVLAVLAEQPEAHKNEN
jgi:hypothetical protein